MGIYNASSLIREARQKAGLTQEQMSEGICSAKVLSRIETGLTNASHATFQALMERAGASYTASPVFDSRECFECFHALKHAHFHLDAWQLSPAWEELLKLADRNWAGNKLYYQEWLLLHCRLQFCSYCCSHRQNFDNLLCALHITRPEINLSDFRRFLLSRNEIRILIALAQEALYLGKIQDCLQIHEQVTTYLSDSKWPQTEKERLQAEDAIVYTKYLIAAGNYEAALETAENSRRKMALNSETAPLLELTFLTGLCCCHTWNPAAGKEHIKAAFYSAYALESCYATVCRAYLRRETAFTLTGEICSRPDIPVQEYPVIQTIDSPSPSEGLCDDAENSGSYPLGRLIQDLRREQKISQSLLCQGLCTGSRLSKIECGSIEPDIMLSEALLQRLGLSDRVFTFWGNEKEKRFHDLKYKILYERFLPSETLDAYLDEMEQLAGERNVLYRQEYLLLKTIEKILPAKEQQGLPRLSLLCPSNEFS